ncbi:MAG: YggS family pyridoxal phosphate-dependent enzyme [Planctomycetota bacterium]
MEIEDILCYNLKNIKQKIAKVCEKIRRNPDEIKILPITKSRPISVIKKLKEFGFTAIGENRIQELEEKYPFLKEDFSFHLVGKLQKKKIKIACRLISAIHSLQDIETAKILDVELSHMHKTVEAFIEVNISGEKNKEGIPPEDLDNFLENATKLRNLQITGFMTMPPQTNNHENSRRYFHQLRMLLEKYSRTYNYHFLRELSMGTSQDFEIAIEEGATVLRLGEAIFKGI